MPFSPISWDRRSIESGSIRAWHLGFVILLTLGICPAQTVRLSPADRLELPTRIDGNSPSYWTEEGLRLFTSIGAPEMTSLGPNQFGPWDSEPVDVSAQNHFPLWIESAWRDEDGAVFGFYHHEPGGVCGDKPLTAPKIGAVVSLDGGRTITELGIVLETGEALDCNTKNEYFAGGHGDFSVVFDRNQGYFYFFFTNYSGPDDQQGIVTARLAYTDRFHPAGAVWKYFEGEWGEPGIGGRMTPIYPATVNWQRENTDSFWGPSVHWNTYLQKYVMLLNRSCCGPDFPQEGIYISTADDPSNPSGWSAPNKLLDHTEIGFGPGFYPQIMGLNWGETDTLASETARLYIHGISDWLITFEKPSDAEPSAPRQQLGDIPPGEATKRTPPSDPARGVAAMRPGSTRR